MHKIALCAASDIKSSSPEWLLPYSTLQSLPHLSSKPQGLPEALSPKQEQGVQTSSRQAGPPCQSMAESQQAYRSCYERTGHIGVSAAGAQGMGGFPAEACHASSRLISSQQCRSHAKWMEVKEGSACHRPEPATDSNKGATDSADDLGCKPLSEPMGLLCQVEMTVSQPRLRRWAEQQMRHQTRTGFVSSQQLSREGAILRTR